jgi:hypothetical protein
MDLLVTFQSPGGETTIEQDDGSHIRMLEQLDASDDIAIKLKTLFEKVLTEARDALPDGGEIEVKISGSLERKASGGGSYLFFNVGAEVSKATTMEVVLKTTIAPPEQQNTALSE